MVVTECKRFPKIVFMFYVFTEARQEISLKLIQNIRNLKTDVCPANAAVLNPTITTAFI